jgi:hypothetical protein
MFFAVSAGYIGVVTEGKPAVIENEEDLLDECLGTDRASCQPQKIEVCGQWKGCYGGGNFLQRDKHGEAKGIGRTNEIIEDWNGDGGGFVRQQTTVVRRIGFEQRESQRRIGVHPFYDLRTAQRKRADDMVEHPECLIFEMIFQRELHRFVKLKRVQLIQVLLEIVGSKSWMESCYQRDGIFSSVSPVGFGDVFDII